MEPKSIMLLFIDIIKKCVHWQNEQCYLGIT